MNSAAVQIYMEINRAHIGARFEGGATSNYCGKPVFFDIF
jgi:hypothetical protein